MMNDSWRVDDDLAADFDGSLSGLGVELGSGAYNMSEALMALPALLKEDGMNTSCETSPSHHASHGFDIKVNQTTFQYVLAAPTSPATKMNEETLTYLNQGQSYQLKLKQINSDASSQGKTYRSIVRIIFHDRRLQFMEQEQIDAWKRARPGERILDVDIPLSYGISDIKVDPAHANVIEFTWDPSIETGVYIQVQCISTEFTAKKHGGEKGVPFRVQVDTFTNDDEEPEYRNSASCQIKVFKPKGADRKHKTDREKMEKFTESEKKNYQPSYECTVLCEPMPEFDNVAWTYHNLDNTGHHQKWGTGHYEDWGHQQAGTGQAWDCMYGHGGHQWMEEMLRPYYGDWFGNYIGYDRLKVPLDQLYTSFSNSANNTSASASLASEPGTELRGSPVSVHSPDPSPCRSQQSLPEEAQSLSPDATAKQTADWLQTNRFAQYVKVFQNFSGADLLRLTRDDLIQICGLADGIRLNNLLQFKVVRPRMTIYVCQESEKVYHAVYLETLEYEELLLKIAQLFSVPLEKICDVFIQGPSGIHVMLTTEVIHNLQDQVRLAVDAMKDEHGQYRILFKTMD
ncbi:transcription factor CP2-like isoform X2 [Lineus longissimus]|uniref:transcription factor CP2-like isoform X2 n=1 Tax=Lineus longissimus TaxID=88925 RepID=UPI00315C6C75